jgi:carboxymethylenebutenolidase
MIRPQHSKEISTVSDRRKSRRPALTEVWAEHTTQEFTHKDVDATMRTMTADPHVINVPVGTGGRGWGGVRDFYAGQFIGRVPRDVQLQLISRTVHGERVVDEMLFSFTHDVEMPWMLPGIAPTGRRVEIPLVAIVGFRDGKVDSEHIYWDQASVLAQVGLLPSTAIPVLAGQAKVLLDPAAPLNTLAASPERR